MDDEESILRSTALLLEDLSFEVVTLGRAERIVETALRERPDVILQDIRMPGLDVERVVREIRAHPDLAQTHIVLFTAGMDAGEIASRVEVQVLEKPFRPMELLQALG